MNTENKRQFGKVELFVLRVVLIVLWLLAAVLICGEHKPDTSEALFWFLKAVGFGIAYLAYKFNEWAGDVSDWVDNLFDDRGEC